MEQLSVKAQRLLEALDEEQRRVIRKDNPLRGDRNELIRELRGRGGEILPLSQVSGLCQTMIKTIIHPKATSKARTSMDAALNDVKTAVEAFYKAASRALSNAQRFRL
ncbi:MAG: hypothetical protein JRJ38_14230 [Deltaproteobacteria bacterium]|nr:hypothetical protein [Deltaproteobacteria bacterium]